MNEQSKNEKKRKRKKNSTIYLSDPLILITLSNMVDFA